MLSLQEISDRLEIQQLAVDYSTAIDGRDFEALDRVFSPDAHIDYRAMGGIAGPFPEVKAWLAGALGFFPAYQHMIANHAITLKGDEAAGRIVCFNPMVMKQPDGAPQTFFLGLWYLDEYRRTQQGWRIVRRSEEKSWTSNVPTGLPA